MTKSNLTLNRLFLLIAGTALISCSSIAISCKSALAAQLDPSQIVPEVVALGITPTITKEVDKKLLDLEYSEDQYFLRINIGKVSPQQFEELIALYGGKSQVPYNPDKNYDFTDFLPPSVQAVVDQTFTPIDYDTSFFDSDLVVARRDEIWNAETEVEQDLITVEWINTLQKYSIQTGINCWNTTINNINSILFGKTEQSFYVPGRLNITPVMDDAPGILVNEGELKAWDALIVKSKALGPYSTSYVRHAALIINDSLVFEKTDSFAIDPIRISLRSDVLKKYQRALEDSFEVVYKRFTSPIVNNAKPLEISPEMTTMLEQNVPNLVSSKLRWESEEGRGGAPYIVIAENAELVINPQTGRGILQAPQEVLSSFKALESEVNF